MIDTEFLLSWLSGRAAAYRADARSHDPVGKDVTLTVAARRAVADELDDAARDVSRRTEQR